MREAARQRGFYVTWLLPIIFRFAHMSGMMMRLTFSVWTWFVPKITLMDEWMLTCVFGPVEEIIDACK